MRAVLAFLAALAASASASPVARQHFLGARDDDAQTPAQTYSDPNANWIGKYRLDQCQLGLPQNVSVASNIDEGAPATPEDAEAILATWMGHSKGQGCINISVCLYDDKGDKSGDSADDCQDLGAANMQLMNLHTPPMETLRAGFGGLETFTHLKVSYRTLAKVASNTIHDWMECRWGTKWSVAAKVPTPPDYYRAIFVREPSARSQSGFFQILSHYLSILKTSPTVLEECLAHFPESSKTDVNWNVDSLGSMGGFPEDCKTAWLKDAFDKKSDKPLIAGASYRMLEATLKSKLLEAVWELPCDCRVLFPDSDGKNIAQNGKEWNYEAKSLFCPKTDTGQKCEISEQQLANLFATALSDQMTEPQTSFGCDAQRFGGEHMHPYSPLLVPAERIDFVMKLETAMDDQAKFEKELAQKGIRVPPLKDPNCTFDAMHGNAAEKELKEELYDADKLKGAIAKSTDLQRRICLMYPHDYLCYGYKMPDACDDMDSWVEETIQRLKDGAEVIFDDASGGGGGGAAPAPAAAPSSQ